MMKSFVYTISVCALILLVTACSSKTEKPDTINYNIPDISEDLADGTYNISGAGEINTPIEEEQDFSVDKSLPNNSVLVIDSDFWSYLGDFKGIETDQNYPLPSNIDINLKMDHSALGLVCPDPNSDAIYYVNYGEDDYIYKLEGDNSSLVLDKKAYFLHIYNNMLYFLSSNTNDTINLRELKGIYKYNLNTGELTHVLDEKVHSLYVNSSGIYYSTYEDYMVGYYLEFNSDIPEKINYTTNLIHYKNYMFELGQEGIVLRNLNTDEEFLVIPISLVSSDLRFGVHEDILYFSYSDKLYSLNLATGDRLIYDFSKYKGLNPDRRYIIWGYTIFQGELIISSLSGIILRVDIETGKVQEVFVQNEDSLFVYSELYTGGNRLFAIGSKNLMNNDIIYKLYELIITDDGYYGITAKELNQ